MTSQSKTWPKIWSVLLKPESYQISYLTSGRDLLRLQLASRDQQPTAPTAAIFANPSYGTGATTAASGRAAVGADLTFGPLPGTAEEAAAIAAQ